MITQPLAFQVKWVLSAEIKGKLFGKGNILMSNKSCCLNQGMFVCMSDFYYLSSLFVVKLIAFNDDKDVI